MQHENSVVAVSEAVTHQARSPMVVVDKNGNYGPAPKKSSVLKMFFVLAAIAVVGWVIVWKMNVANMRPAFASMLAPVAASVTAAAVPPTSSTNTHIAVATHREPVRIKSKPRESATPGLDAFIEKLNHFLRD